MRHCFCIMLLSAMLCLPASGHAASYGPPLSTLDVAGVTLGMTPKAAAEALKNFDKRFEAEKKYRGGERHALFEIESKPDKGVLPPGLLCGYEAEELSEDAHELVWIYFMPSVEQNADKEEVVAVFRWKTYLKDYPKVETLVKNITGKVGAAPTFEKNTNSLDMNTGVRAEVKDLMWCFNGRGKLENGPGIKNRPVNGSYIPWAPKKNVGISSLMPQRISTDQPINLQLNIESTPDNPLLVKGFTQIILDVDKYYTSLVRGKEMLLESAALNEKKKNESAASASSRQEKF